MGGGGLDHRKWHGSGRLAIAPGGVPLYALYEWARTDEHDGDALAFSFESDLFEAAIDVGAVRVAGRWERTTRPEEARLEDPFRSARPHEDATLLGVTRWRGLTLHVAHRGPAGELSIAPFVEVARQNVREITGGIFDPVSFYGGAVQWSFSAGLRVSTGIRHGRAGRYGVALPDHASGMAGPAR
jgi:hypothetical protein